MPKFRVEILEHYARYITVEAPTDAEAMTEAQKLTDADPAPVEGLEFRWREPVDAEEDDTEAARICDKWAARLGLGFHPDTRGADYRPELSAEDCADYDSDMETLFGFGGDPYAFGVEAMERAGLC